MVFARLRSPDISVTAMLSQRVQASMTILTFSGVDTSGTNGSGAIGAVGGASGSSGRSDRHADYHAEQIMGGRGRERATTVPSHGSSDRAERSSTSTSRP